MNNTKKVTTEENLNIVSEAIQKSLLSDFAYVSTGYDIEEGVSINVDVNDINLIEYIELDEIDYILHSKENARKFYRDLVRRLKTQHIKIVDLKDNFITPTNLENIKKTDFLLMLEQNLQDILNDKYVGKIYDSERHRVLGKTTSLAYLSMKYDIPIILSNPAMEKIIERDFPEARLINFSKFVRGVLKEDIVLVDELDSDKICEVQQTGVKFLGFVRY